MIAACHILFAKDGANPVDLFYVMLIETFNIESNVDDIHRINT